MSLRDRINALNATTASTSTNNNNNNNSSSSLPSTSRTTGAAGSIKDKIGKFQANAEVTPLVPIGSFGLGGVRRDPSSSEGGNNKSRVASLGGGRAAVPLGVVKARSSMGNVGTSTSSSGNASREDILTDNNNSTTNTITTTTTTTNRISSNPSSSRSSSIDSHSNASSTLTGYKTPTDSTPPQSNSPPSSTDMMLEDLPTRMRTGPGSISSMNVETGSVEGEDLVIGSGNDTPTTQSAYASPVSSPIVEASQFGLVEPNSMNLNSDSTITTTSTPLQHQDHEVHNSSKGPVAALLKEPGRSLSVVSVSSMIVEDGSQAATDVANLSEVDHIDLNEKEEIKSGIPTSVGEVEGDVTEVSEVPEHSEEIEKLREEQTKKELKRYEEEVEDATVIPGLPSMETRQSTAVAATPAVPVIAETLPVEAPSVEIEEPKELVEERILKTPEPMEFEQKHDTPVLSTFTTLDSGSPTHYPASSVLTSFSSEAEPNNENELGDYKMGGRLGGGHERRESDVTLELTPKSEASELGEDDPLLTTSARGSTTSSAGGFVNILMEQPEMHNEISIIPPSPGMPKVKCNDCSEEVDLMELADHTCAPSFLPPAISSPFSSSPKSLPPLATSSTSSSTHPDVPLSDDDEPEIAGAFPSPKSTRFTTLSPSRSAWGSSSTSSPPATGTTPPQDSPTTLKKKSLVSSRLDSYVPVTKSLVPDDVDVDEEEEDDNEFFKSNSIANQTLPDSPLDANFPNSFTYMNSLVGSNRLSQVSRTSSGDSSTRDLSGWGSRSSIGGVPGVDDDDESQEQDYEGGSVTIVRSTASHRIETQP